jgi:hypothetical protein
MAIFRKQEQSLGDEIRNVRAKAAAYIDALVAAERKNCPGVPDWHIRHGITGGLEDTEAVLQIMARQEAERAA